MPAAALRRMSRWQQTLFDKIVAARLEANSETVCLSFASFGRETIERAKSLGAMTVVERASAHARERLRILREEHERFGLERFLDPGLAEAADAEEEEYELADYISVPSDFAATSFARRGFRAERIFKTAFGVDGTRFSPSDSPTSEFRVLCVGGVGLEKGTPDLLQAMALLKSRLPELHTIGTPPEWVLSLLSTACVGVNWVRHSPMRQENLAALYKSASVYCLLSVQEGMSLTILEAMASGLPVIASENTGAADIVTDGYDGFVVPIRRPDLAAARIDQLQFDTDLRIGMGANARKTAMTLTWKRYGSTLYDAMATAWRKEADDRGSQT